MASVSCCVCVQCVAIGTVLRFATHLVGVLAGLSTCWQTVRPLLELVTSGSPMGGGLANPAPPPRRQNLDATSLTPATPMTPPHWRQSSDAARLLTGR